MSKPYVNGDLVDAAAALVLCQHDSPLVIHGYEGELADVAPVWNIEGDLAAARTAASAYLVACFDAALTWNDDDE
jgi:hypothetical protein